MSPRRAAPPDPSCTVCGGMPRLASAMRGSVEDRRAEPVWRCRCGAEVGCHPGTLVALGRPADRDTRMLRIRAHFALDALVAVAVEAAAASRNGRRDRERERSDVQEARCHLYALLARELGLEPARAHVGSLGREGCGEAVAFLEGLDRARIRNILPRGDAAARRRPASRVAALRRGAPEGCGRPRPRNVRMGSGVEV